MSIAYFDKGDLIRATNTFTNAAGTVLDPTDVYCKYQVPGSSVTTLHYGVDGALVKEQTGIYHVDISATAAGTYYVRFYSTGTGQAAVESSFCVQESRF
jgi:hypothetical protein